MFVRALCVIAATGAAASVASATVTELSIFRQTAVRARSGSIGTPTTDQSNNTNQVMGPFVDSRTATATGAGASFENVTHNTNISNGFYTGTMHADGHADGNSGGSSDSSASYGSSPNAFQSTFSVAFSVDVPTLAHFFGNAVCTSSGGGSSGGAQIIFGDTLDGVPQSPIILAQPTSNLGVLPFDVFINLLPGHRYSFTATTTANTNRTFAAGAGNASSDINFTADIPAPGAAALLGLGGLCTLRRRRVGC